MIPQYRKLAATGQIEISTTPFYHPILPLLCDSDIASVSHPGVPLPPRFRYPEDARLQLERAHSYIETTFGVPPAGLWPSEGSVSDEALTLAADAGFKWAATDNGVLARTLNRAAGADVTYRPYRWEREGRELGMIFRDHLLSDLIGFVYSGMNPQEAANDFLRRIRDNCASILAAGEDAMVPVILDGENAWEYYERGGRPFFRALYGGIQDDPSMEAVTVSEAHARLKSTPLDHIFPGSWINANFDVWIGAEEDNKAWRLLLAAREAWAGATNATEAQRARAMEELLISEGSDWNWWYGPEHDTANAVEFDQIYREHLANVYRALDLAPPAELSHPILTIHEEEVQTSPSGPISPKINGRVDSYFEWMGAGVFRVDTRQGSMHGKRTLVREVHYGSDDRAVYLRVEFAEPKDALSGVEARISVTGLDDVVVRLENGGARSLSAGAEAGFADILEISVPLKGADSEVSLTFWQDGLPIEAVPRQGALAVAASTEWTN